MNWDDEEKEMCEAHNRELAEEQAARAKLEVNGFGEQQHKHDQYKSKRLHECTDGECEWNGYATVCPCCRKETTPCGAIRAAQLGANIGDDSASA